MKRLMCLSTILLLLFFITACNNSAIDENFFVIKIENKTDMKINEVNIDLYKDGKLKSSQGSVNADGSNIERDETIVFEYNEQDIDLEGEASFILSFSDNDQNTLVLDTSPAFQLAENEEVHFAIVGELDKKVEVTKVD
jgi:hypothetical protein